MQTVLFISFGFVLLGILFAATKDKPAAARRFGVTWLLVCLGHLAYGVLVAGYGLVEELGIHAGVFGLPVAIAFILARVLKPKA